MSPTGRLQSWLQPLLVLILLAGCWLVLRPFFTAILFATVIAISTWPAFDWLLRRMGGRRNIVSLLACILVMLAMMGPAALLTVSLVEALGWFATTVQAMFEQGHEGAPTWLSHLPFVGDYAVRTWNGFFSSGGELTDLLRELAAPLRGVALSTGRALGGGVIQVAIAVFLLFFLFRDGERIGSGIRDVVGRVGGGVSLRLLATAQHTVVGVMLGAIGTALAQSMVAMLGYAIAGVPSPFLLGAATFVLSLVPIGPPIIWIGASIWLFRDGSAGWAIFMLLYGFFAISSIDNLVKPLLISRTSSLSFALTFLGVTGGVIAFGFMGVFLGPTLLAVVASLARAWADSAALGPEPEAPPAD